MKRVLVLLSFIVFSNLLAEEQNSINYYYQKSYLGEKKGLDYFGPINPLIKFQPDTGTKFFIDDSYYDEKINRHLNSSLFELQSFWTKEVLEKSTCPNEELSKNLDYIQYLYRLITMSYLFESIKIHNRVLVELGLNNKSCQLSYNELFGKCNPVSDDMKKFKERVAGKFVNEIEKIKYTPLSKKESESWIQIFKLSNKKSLDPTFSRLHLFCLESGINCLDLSFDELKIAVSTFCDRDKKIIDLICNERDDLQGISYVKKVDDIIKSSNAFQLINKNGMGEDCLRRFSKINARKEYIWPEFENLFLTIFSSLQKENSSYIQGSLYLPGALKEFDMKGMGDFLNALRPAKIAIVKPIKTQTPVLIKPVKKINIAVPKVEPPVIESVQEIVEAPVPIEKLSEFERAVANRTDKDLERELVDMSKFKLDFEFTSTMISALSKSMSKFQTRQGLKDLKDLDRFGSVEAPVGIIFLKFLIDTENHQALFNVVNILGNKFFIFNDFENKTVPLFIELKNDPSTNNRWQIILLRPPLKNK